MTMQVNQSSTAQTYNSTTQTYIANACLAPMYINQVVAMEMRVCIYGHAAG